MVMVYDTVAQVQAPSLPAIDIGSAGPVGGVVGILLVVALGVSSFVNQTVSSGYKRPMCDGSPP